jgi:hypothetical protein
MNKHLVFCILIDSISIKIMDSKEQYSVGTQGFEKQVFGPSRMKICLRGKAKSIVNESIDKAFLFD